MPNWIEGTMRIRGNGNDIMRFLKEGIDEPERLSKIEDSEKRYKLNIEEDGSFEGENAEDMYISDTRRAFINGDFYGMVYADKESVVVIPIRQAWAWSPENFENLSKKYDLDFRLLGWEKGMEFEEECICLRGKKAICNEKQYEDWNWDAPCPNMGG